MDQTRVTALGAAGFLVGAFLGFLARPAAPFMGQLPLEIVISRGASLKGLDQMLVPLAESSFNTMAAGAIIGVVVGIIIAVYALPSSR